MKTYKGFNIYRQDNPTYALKYYAYTSLGKVAADTLQGIKIMINDKLLKGASHV